MADENKPKKVVSLVRVYAGHEHVADMPQDQFDELKEAEHPVYAYPYGNAPKPDNN